MAKAKAKAKKKVTTKKEVEPKMEGLGDLVEKVTEATGIKKVVKAVFGDDCGCDERREKLNKLLSFKTAECLTEDSTQRIRTRLDLANGEQSCQLVEEYLTNVSMMIWVAEDA